MPASAAAYRFECAAGPEMRAEQDRLRAEAPSTTPSVTGAAVELDRLAKRFGGVAAVDGISLAIEPGEFITLLGPSGSGKTTTLMMIAGFEIPTDGEIFVDGKPIVATPPYRRNIGMVFQSYALFPHMTVAENIGFPLRQRNVDRRVIARRVAEVLEIVKLPGHEGRYPRQLSGGQQQRVALARAIVFRPRVLLMDEPLGALDKQLREGLQLEIKRLHDELGITFVYVTHDQEEALVMSDRIAVMRAGRIEQLGIPSDLYDRPSNRFVATFIGQSNFLEGVVLRAVTPHAEIKVGEDVLRAVVASEIKTGAEVSLTVRPEKLCFRDETAPRPREAVNRFAASVLDVTFVGECCRYRLRTASGAVITLKQQQRFGTRTYRPGEQVEIECHVEDTRLV